MLHRAFKHPVVVRPGGGNHVIFRRFGRARLQQFLQLALRIFDDRQHVQFAEGRAKFAQNEFARRLKSAVQKNRAEQRFKRVRQRGRAFAPAVHFLAAAQNQMRAEAEGAGVFGQRAAVDEFCARLGQRTFIERGKFLVKLLRQDELQHGVAEKFQPLIVRGLSRRFVPARRGFAWLMGDGRMRERQPQQALVAERVAETGLKFGNST